MKVTIPEELKKDVPASTWGKILSATPVVMAVIATMLAGLASSEMTRAQYDRALAAQQQSKAGDQWSFFQAKRLRGAYQRNTADLLQAVAEVHELDASKLKAATERLANSGEAAAESAKTKTELLTLLDSTDGQEALAHLKKGDLPSAGSTAAIDPRIKSAIDAVDNLSTDAEIGAILSDVDNQALDAAVRAARDRAQAFDAATKPLNQAIDRFENLLDRLAVGLASAHFGTDGLDTLGRSLNRDFTAARLGLASQRYEVEARLNQAIASLYELQVRKSNFSAERHHARSERFFFGMLAAQLGVIISTFAIAARQKNLLWSLAAVAGFAAVGFAIYVYLKV